MNSHNSWWPLDLDETGGGQAVIAFGVCMVLWFVVFFMATSNPPPEILSLREIPSVPHFVTTNAEQGRT